MQKRFYKRLTLKKRHGVKILHFSDTHLGFSDLETLNDENINQREADFYDAFAQVVAKIKEIRPDYIIHTGDLFHRASPSNRAIAFALEQFKIINDLTIPFILIAGNHSTPRTNLSAPILQIFENFENVYVAYKQKYEKIEFADALFHALPHMNDETQALSQIELCEAALVEGKKNILMMHCSVGAHYLMAEFGEWVFPREKEAIFTKMDYVALGHWHGFGKVGKHENVYYSGSTERTSLGDKRNTKGFILLTLGGDTLFDAWHVEFCPIKIRSVIQKEIDAKEYENSLSLLDTSDTQDAIVEVRLVNLTPLQSIEIQNAEIKKLFPHAMNVSIKREFIHDGGTASYTDDVATLSLEEVFLEHLKEQSQESEFARLKEKTQELFAAYEETNDDTL